MRFLVGRKEMTFTKVDSGKTEFNVLLEGAVVGHVTQNGRGRWRGETNFGVVASNLSPSRRMAGAAVVARFKQGFR